MLKVLPAASGLIGSAMLLMPVPAAAKTVTVTKPGIMCRDARALAILTRHGGDSRTHLDKPTGADLYVVQQGGCVDLQVGTTLDVEQEFYNTAITSGDVRYTVPRIDLSDANMPPMAPVAEQASVPAASELPAPSKAEAPVVEAATPSPSQIQSNASTTPATPQEARDEQPQNTLVDRVANDISRLAGGYLVWVLAFGLAFIVLYFIPSIMANQRGTVGSGWIFFVNFFTGWTMFGWLACLVWAVLGERRIPRG